MQILLRIRRLASLAAVACALAVVGLTPPTAQGATLVKKGAYAYDVTLSANSTNGNVTVTYKLNGLPKDVTVILKINGTATAYSKSGCPTTGGINTVTFSDVDGHGTLSADIKVTSNANTGTAPVKISETPDANPGWADGHPKFVKPFSITINNCVESPTFGTILVTENSSGDATYYSSTSNDALGEGYFYAFDPQMQGYKEGNATVGVHYGFRGGSGLTGMSGTTNADGLTHDGAMTGNNENCKLRFHRMRYTADGRLFFISSSDASTSGIREISTDVITNLNWRHGEIFSGAAWAGGGLDVWGSGSNLKIGFTTLAGRNNWSKGKVHVLNIGTNNTTTFTSATASTAAIVDLQRPIFHQIHFDKDGNGLFACTNSSTNNTSDPGSLHLSVPGLAVTNNGGDTKFGSSCSMAYNKDYSLVAISGSGIITIYPVTWNAAGTMPTFGSEKCHIGVGVKTTDIAWDYANNVYYVNQSDQNCVGLQLPSSVVSDVTTTPTRTSQNVTFNHTATGVSGLAAGTAAWSADGQSQTVPLTWTATTGAASYNIYRDGAKIGTSTSPSYSAALAMVAYTAAQSAGNVFTVKAVINGTESAPSNSVQVLGQPYPAITASAVREITADYRADVVLSWTAPTKGTVAKYQIFSGDNSAGPADDMVEARLPASQTTYTFEDVPNFNRTYRVVAVMTNMLNTTRANDDCNAISNLTDPTSSVGNYPAPTITNVKVYDGYNAVTIDWGLSYHGSLPSYYVVSRDGVRVTPRADYQTYIDERVPDGTHNYVVTAVYADGTTRNSQPRTASVHRDHAVTAYGLEEIYNYPIFKDATKAAENGYNATNAVIGGVNGVPTNIKDPAGGTGGYGDTYRQGAYRNGKWYLAQLTDANAILHTDVPSWYTQTTFVDNLANEWPMTHTGGIVTFNANDPRTGMTKIITKPALSNMSIALDGRGPNVHFFSRACADPLPADKDTYNRGTEQNIFYLPWKTMQASNIATDGTITNSRYDISSLVPPYEPTLFANGQTNRVHYISADGTTNANTRVFMAMCHSLECYVVNPYNSTFKKFTAPSSAQINSENYAAPVTGRRDFLHVIRSSGIYDVNYDTGDYTPVYTRMSNCSSAGVETFTFNDELFIIDPTSTKSNNTGHFRIDMVKRPLRAGSTTEHVAYTEAPINNDALVPMVSFTQPELTNWLAGNANGMWFGTEYDATENCVYIYQYVPGVRFAKYKFYSYNDFPAVQPTLTMSIKHDATDDNITDFEASIGWDRPEEYAHSENRNYIIDRYVVKLLDANKNVVHSWTEQDPGANIGTTTHFSENYEHEPGSSVYPLDWQTYTVEVTPIFRHIEDATRTIAGEVGVAMDEIDYPVAIDPIRVKGFVDQAHGPLYRVDIDFDRADMNTYKEPVSHFELEYKAPGGEWAKIPNLRLRRGADTYYAADETEATIGYHWPAPLRHDGKVWGNYNFGKNNPTSASNAPRRAQAMAASCEKGYAVNNPEADAFPVVAYYVTTQNPAGYQYRAKAVYAANNPYIRKEATKEATLSNSFVATGIVDISNDAATARVRAYPVPCIETLTIVAPQAIDKIEIYAENGAIALRVAGNDDSQQTINVSTLSAGYYLVRVNSLEPVRIVKK